MDAKGVEWWRCVWQTRGETGNARNAIGTNVADDSGGRRRVLAADLAQVEIGRAWWTKPNPPANKGGSAGQSQ
jgi:hypothetical protein